MESRDRSKRHVSSNNRASALEELKRLKREGKSTLSMYQHSANDLYDEVEEDEYNSIVRQRVQRSNEFVVDDDGLGYNETGLEIWDQPREDYLEKEMLDSEEEAYMNTDKKKSKIQPPQSKGLFFKPRILAPERSTSSESALTTSKPSDEAFAMLLKQLESNDTTDASNNATNISIKLDDILVKPLTVDDPPVIDNSIDIIDDYNDIDAISIDQPQSQPKTKTFQTIAIQNVEQFKKDLIQEKEIQSSPIPDSFDTNKPSIIDPSSCIDPDDCIKFFWVDAYERSNGQVLLIGKVWCKSSESFISSCLTIKNIQRNLFFLPRQSILNTDIPVGLQDIYDEISQIAQKHNISKFGCKKVTRKYAFELADIPEEADYLKVIYGYDISSVLDSNMTGRTFSKVFGTNTSALEMLIIKRKLMGPSWLTIKQPTIVKKNISWCKLELECENPKLVSPLDDPIPSPPIHVAGIQVKTWLTPEHRHEVLMITIISWPSISMDSSNSDSKGTVIHAVRPVEHYGLLGIQLNDIFQKAGIKVQSCQNERALLGFFLATLHRLDPDIIVGHNFFGFDYGVLLHRLREHKLDRWSRIGRLVFSNWPRLSSAFHDLSYAERQLISGRLVCDTYLLSKDLVKSKNYSLKELASNQLGMEKEDVTWDMIPSLITTQQGWVQLVKSNEWDTWLSVQLAFKLMAIPLTKQLTNLAGNLWSHTLAGSRAERNEYLLLHEFHNNKFICPDKQNIKYSMNVDEDDEHTGKRKATYTGGLVLEPKAGFYSKVILLLDFNSLYPSIIQEFNICFTTIERFSSNSDDDAALPLLPDKSLPGGILPKLLSTLVSRRRQVKKMMSDSKISTDEYAQLDIRQKALKLTANSMYGCLGFPYSRFYARPLAMLITAQGREILQNTVDLVQSQCNMEVIYGDTDSIMVATGSDSIEEAKKIGYSIKKVVNEKYRLLEIELDGLFGKLLLLKKKKYAALVIEEKGGSIVKHLETKGLDLVRRDWCGLSIDLSSYILNKLMNGDNREDTIQDIHQHISQVALDSRENKIPLEKFVIFKSLTKNPEDYADAKSQPHVLVALQMRAKGRIVRAGDTIPYVITMEDGHGKGLAYRAYHPDDLNNAQVKLDIDWYLQQQIYPPITRLLQPIEGTDTGRIAYCLGLKHSNYEGEEAIMNERHEGNKFSQSVPLKITCEYCSVSFEMRELINESSLEPGWMCLDCKQLASIRSLWININHVIRNHLLTFYQNWAICDEMECRHRTRTIGVYEKRCPMVNCKGILHQEYTDSRIYYQLLYLKEMFDIQKYTKTMNRTSNQDEERVMAILAKHKMMLTKLCEYISGYVSKCAYPRVDLGQIFKCIRSK